MKQRLLVAVMLLMLGIVSGYAQQGFLKGKVTDKITGEELVGAAIVVDGTTTGTITNFMGEFVMPPLEAGTYTFKVQYISYDPQIFTDIVIIAGEEKILNVQLAEATMDIAEIAVVAKANRESENLLLLEQKNAAVGKTTIGAQQLSVQGVSDASNAVTKVTGVSKEEGGSSLNIRGLGDRYNSTTFNGLPLPSNNADLKNIDLALFSTDIIEYIGVEKVFTSQIIPDVAGANIDIVSKKHTGTSYFLIEGSSGINTNVLNVDDFKHQDGSSFLGFDSFKKPSSSSLSGRHLNSYDFKNSLNPQSKTISPNIGLGLSTGNTFKINGGDLNTFFTLSYGNDYKYNDRIERKVNGSGIYRMDMMGGQYEYSTQSTALLNLNYTKGKTDIYINTALLNSSNEEFKELVGYKIDVVPTENDEGLLRRSQFLRNLVMVNQFLAKHKFSETLNADFKFGYNSVNNTVPDRRYNIFITETNGITTPGDNDAADNHRYFHELNENELSAYLALSKTFGDKVGDLEYTGKLKIGGAYRSKSRDFLAEQYNHDLLSDDEGNISSISSTTSVDDYFNASLLNNTFKVGYLPQSYNGSLDSYTGFASLEYAISKKLLAVIGLRYEYLKQNIKTSTTLRPNGDEGFKEANLFPSISLRYKLNDKSNLRFASSSTYTLPQFVESAPFLFENTDEVVYGNPYITPSKNYNFDLKWEFFPKTGEVISLTTFGKYLVDPINKFVLASAGNEFSFANTGDWATIFGLELETKKNLMNIPQEGGYKKLVASLNLSLMKTNQELKSEKIQKQTEGRYNANFSVKEEELQGAAPVLINSSLSYIKAWSDGKKSFTSTLVYGYTSDKINTIGYVTVGNQIDKAVNNLDFIIKSKINKLGLSISIKNILNQDIDRVQENTNEEFLIRSIKKGVKFKLGLSYKF